MNQKIFSLPINPKAPPEFIQNEFIPFLMEHKDYIYDLYFTCRMPPFIQDAMGDVFVSSESEFNAVHNALAISAQTGIPLSATFNNVNVIPNDKNLTVFLVNFQRLYDAGVRCITIPFTHWVPIIKKTFPDLFIKNTILRNVTRANEIVTLAEAGFDYINLDRDLMRDEQALIEIKAAKDWVRKAMGKDIMLSLLANEGCRGNCPLMDEHYQYNNTRSGDAPQYFNSAISNRSCSEWALLDKSYHLKVANIPPWREDWERFRELGIDVFKMHGREYIGRLKESMEIIRKYAKGDAILFPNFDEYLEEANMKDRPINAWRQKIRTCKFDCWSCNYCDKVIESRVKEDLLPAGLRPYIEHILNSVDNAKALVSKLDRLEPEIPALTSHKVLHFLNNLVGGHPKGSDVKYLELGSGTGFTTVGALYRNSNAKGIAYDKFVGQNNAPAQNKKQVLPNTEEVFTNHMKARGIENYALHKDEKSLFKAIESEGVDIVFDDLNEVDVLYRLDLYRKIIPAIKGYGIIVLDDANWNNMVEALQYILKKCNVEIMYDKKLLNSIEDSLEFWNGLQVLVVRKR